MITKSLKGGDGFRARFPSEKSYIDYCSSLLVKAQQGDQLTVDEQVDFCTFISKKVTSKYSFCKDEFFIRDFLDYNWNENNINSPNHFLRKKIKKYWQSWKREIEKLNHSDEILKQVSKETRDCKQEIFRISKKSRHKKIEIDLLLFSRYVYIIIKRIFMKIGENHIELKNNVNIFHIDPFTLAHSLIRHYGPDLQKFGNIKSYFSFAIEYDQLHEHLEYIFKEIDSKGYVLSNIKNINIEYNNEIYQIYTKEVIKYFKGNYSTKINRINTFYPITNIDEISQIGIKLKHKINDNLFVFE